MSAPRSGEEVQTPALPLAVHSDEKSNFQSEPGRFSLKGVHHLLMTAGTGGGKSNTNLQILKGAPNVFYFSTKHDDVTHPSWEAVYADPLDDKDFPAQADSLVEFLRNDFASYNGGINAGKERWVIIDEINDLMDGLKVLKDKDVLRKFNQWKASVIRKGRALGYHLVMSGQSINCQSLDISNRDKTNLTLACAMNTATYQGKEPVITTDRYKRVFDRNLTDTEKSSIDSLPDGTYHLVWQNNKGEITHQPITEIDKSSMKTVSKLGAYANAN